MPDVDKLSQKGKRKRRLRWWHFTLALLVMLALVAVIVWNNRYDILEDQAKKWLKGQGFDAELEIVDIGKTRARLKDIRLSQNGEPVLRTKSIDLDYAFKQALDGQFQRIVIHEPNLVVHIDEKGNIIDDWLPESSGKNPGLVLPPKGVLVEDAQINWSAPFGGGTAVITADIESKNEWTLDVDAPNTEITDGENAVVFDLKAALFSNGPDAFTVSGRMDADQVSLPVLNAIDLANDFRFDVTREADGKIEAKGFTFVQSGAAQIVGVSIGSNAARFDVQGRYDPTSKTIETLTSNWDIDTQSAALIDPDRRRALAQMLTVENAVQVAPIGKHFIGDITDHAAQLLVGADVSGKGRFALTENGYTIHLEAPLIAKSQNQTLRLAALQDIAFLDFNRAAQSLHMRADADWQSPRALVARDLNVNIVSRSGMDVKGVKSLSANINSRSTWQERVDGIEARLAPINLQLQYQQRDKQRTVKIGGDVDYDGPVPGGNVQGLRAGGVLDMTLSGKDFILDYNPDGDVALRAFTNASGWQVTNIDASVTDGRSLLSRKRATQPFAVTLANVSADLTSPGGDRHLSTGFDTMIVNSDFSREPQLWDIEFSDMKISSEDFPAPGTRIASPGGTLAVKMSQQGELSFEASSPVTEVETENFMMSTLTINASGTPDDIAFTYDTPQVTLKGADVPVLPAKGEGRFTNGVLSGQAVSFLPKTRNMPINIDFRSENGIGAARINMERLVFSPSGLQPQDLIPTLRGKLAEVRGPVQASFDVGFGGNQPMRSRGKVSLLGLDVGTLVGPFSGIMSELEFSSIFPLKSEGVQTVKIASFDPGFPLKDGEVDFEIVPGGVRIDRAVWPVINKQDDVDIGKIEILPTYWRFGGVENRMTVRIEDLSLGAVAETLGKGKIYATGQITGELPVIVDGVNVIVDQGVMRVKDGGIIRYTSSQTEALIREGANTDREAFAESDYHALAFRALQDFRYNELEARLNGPLDGDMLLRFAFDGANQEVLSGQPFAFDLKFKGELANLMRNLTRSLTAGQSWGDLLQSLEDLPELTK